MFIENFDRIYGESLYTQNTMYKVEKDTMTIAPHHHTLRLIPEVGKSSEPKTIVLMKTNEGIKIGVYIDREWNPILIKDTRFRDIKTLSEFKILLSTIIEPCE